MKFFAIFVIAAIAVCASANPHEHQQKKFQNVFAHARNAAEQQPQQQQQIIQEQMMEGQGQAREMDDNQMMELDRQKKSYGSGGAKCGKAVVVACAPLVQKVKCKGGHSAPAHKGAYSENVEQHVYPETDEYEAGPYIQYV